MQGQDAVNTAKAFRDALPLTGVVLTKLDGDARGGAALSVRHVTGAPIKFAGVAEKIDGLEVFHPERMASRILGMGDVLSLIEDAQKNVDVEEAKKLAKKVKSGKGFDLDRLQGADRPDAQDGRARGACSTSCRRSSRARRRARRSTSAGSRRIEGIIDSMTPRRARQAGDPQGVAQAAHRRGRRRLGAGGEPAAQPVRADAEDDEDGRQGRHAEDDARNEGHAAGDALVQHRSADAPSGGR